MAVLELSRRYVSNIDTAFLLGLQIKIVLVNDTGNAREKSLYKDKHPLLKVNKEAASSHLEVCVGFH